MPTRRTRLARWVRRHYRRVVVAAYGFIAALGWLEFAVGDRSRWLLPASWTVLAVLWWFVPVAETRPGHLLIPVHAFGRARQVPYDTIDHIWLAHTLSTDRTNYVVLRSGEQVAAGLSEDGLKDVAVEHGLRVVEQPRPARQQTAPR